MNDSAPASNGLPPQGAPAKPGMSKGVKVLLGCALMVPLLACCIGVAAAVALPSFLAFTARSKAAEATTQVRVLADRVSALCHERGATPNAGPLPTIPGPERQAVDFSRDPGFAALGFAPTEALYYSYLVIAEPDGASVVLAEGDLDGDGERSRFQVNCSAACACGDLLIERETE